MSRRHPVPPGPLTLAIEVSNPSAGGAGGMVPALRSHADQPGTPDASSGTGDILGPSVALARGMLVLDQEPLITADRHDDDLMPAIDRLVRRAGFTARDLERIAVSIGPGGFTGLRVAVATAKALGEAIIARGGSPNCCVSVPSARIVAHHHLSSRPAANFAVALASKRDTVWFTVFSSDGSPIPLLNTSSDNPGLLASAADLGAISGSHSFTTLVADQHLPPSIRESAAALGIAVVPPTFSAAACARVAAALTPINPAALVPLYPREPEAVTKWRTLHPSPGPQP